MQGSDWPDLFIWLVWKNICHNIIQWNLAVSVNSRVRMDEFEKPTKYLQGFYVSTVFNRVTFLLPSAAALCLYALHSHSVYTVI